METLTNFGVYSTWLFWGIGIFFHWLSVFGFKNLLGSSWEEKKIRELMKKGSLTEYLSMKHYVEWPDKYLKYDKVKKTWVSTGLL